MGITTGTPVVLVEGWYAQGAILIQPASANPIGQQRLQHGHGVVGLSGRGRHAVAPLIQVGRDFPGGHGPKRRRAKLHPDEIEFASIVPLCERLEFCEFLGLQILPNQIVDRVASQFLLHGLSQTFKRLCRALAAQGHPAPPPWPVIAVVDKAALRQPPPRPSRPN